MLVALLAITLPLIIEWLFRRRKRQIDLPTIRYLLRNKEQQKVKREDRLLLLLRMLVLLLLVMALTRPRVPRQVFRRPTQRHIVVAIDGSASMQQEVGVTTAFAQARMQAAALLRDDNITEGARATIVYMAREPANYLEASEDLHMAAARIEEWRPGSGTVDLARNLKWIEEAIERRQKERSEAIAERRSAGEPLAGDELEEMPEVYIFSDFQKTSWPSDDPDLNQTLGNISDLGELYLADVGTEHDFNYMVTGLEPEEDAIVAGFPISFRVTVDVNAKPGWQPSEDDRAYVEFLVDGARQERRSIPPITERRSDIQFTHTFPEAGDYVVQVILEGDEHQADNDRLYTVQVPESLPILVLDETFDPQDAGSLAADSAFLARAIAPPEHPGYKQFSVFSTNVIHPFQLIYENLDFAVREIRPDEPGEAPTYQTEGYVAVVVTGISNLRPDVVGRLQSYVENGGKVLFFLNDRVRPAHYNRMLYRDPTEAQADGDDEDDPLRGQSLLPARLVRTTNVEDTVPLFATATGGRVPSFGTGMSHPDTRLQKMCELDVHPRADVLLRAGTGPTDAGQPLLVRKRVGGYGGEVWLANMSASPSWTTLQARAEFPLLIQELLRGLVGQPNDVANLDVGQTFQQLVYASAQPLLVYLPDGRTSVRVSPPPTPRGEEPPIPWEMRFSQTYDHGVYRVEPSQHEVARTRFVVNQDAEAESDLTRHSRRDLENELDFGRTWDAVWFPRGTDIASYIAGLHGVTELAPGLLWILIAALAVESYLAARFGRRRGGVQT